MLKQHLLSIVVSAEYVTIPIYKLCKLNDDYNYLTQLLYSVINGRFGSYGGLCLEAHDTYTLTEPDQRYVTLKSMRNF